MIKFSCPHCAKTFAVQPELVGRRFKCAECGGAITVPDASCESNEGSLLDDLAALDTGPAQGTTDPNSHVAAAAVGPPSTGGGSERIAAIWSLTPMPLKIGLVCVPLALLIALLSWMSLRDTWEQDNRARIVELHESARAHVAAGGHDAAAGDWQALLDLVGDRKLADEELVKIVGHARDGHEQAGARKFETARGPELKKLAAQAVALRAESRFVEAHQRCERILDLLRPIERKTAGLRQLHTAAMQEKAAVVGAWSRSFNEKLGEVLETCRLDEANERFATAMERLEEFNVELVREEVPAEVQQLVMARINEIDAEVERLHVAHQEEVARLAKLAKTARPVATKKIKRAAPVTEEPAPKVFARLFADRIAEVKATRDLLDDAKLAGEMLMAVDAGRASRTNRLLTPIRSRGRRQKWQTSPAVVVLVCEKAYALGASHLSGWQHAVDAMRRLERVAPQRKVECRRKAVEAALKHLWLLDKGAPTANQVIDLYLVLGSAHLEQREPYEALEVFSKAGRIGREAKEAPVTLIAQRMSEARAMIKYLKRLAELLDALEQAPADQALLLELVGIYLYEQDDPRLALPYVRRLDSASDTVELVRHVPLAARGLAMLSTDDLLVLGRWYAARGIDKDHPNRVAMLTRARLYYEQFLQTYKDRDEVRVQVARDRRQVERNLAELGVGMKEGRRLVKKMRGGDLGAPVNPAIQQAIDRGVAYLYSIVDDETYWDKPNSSDHSFGGYTALAAYALMMADEDPNGRPELRRAIDWLFARPMKGTYALCFRAHLWETLPTDKRQEMVIRKDLGVLRKIGNSRGTYGYYLRRAGRYDISTTLAAMLTFWLGETNGLQGTDPVWTRSVRHLITVQNSDGGWGYNPSDPASAGTKGSMTAAALTILLMAIDQNHLDAEASLKAEADESIARAMEWMDSKFLPDSNPNSGMSNYLYYLATVQHVGLMSGRRTFNGHEWYESAAEHLLKTQHPNGSWGNVADTAFAVVFLARGGNMYESDSGGYFEDEPGPDSMSGPSAANRMGAEAPKTDAATMGAATSRPAIGAQ